MKMFICGVVCFLLFITCNQRNNNENNEVQLILSDTLLEEKQSAVHPIDHDVSKIKIDKNLLEGIWAESEDENANFWIKNDSMYFLEDYNNPSYIELRNDTLITHYETFITIDVVLKVTSDSLYLLNQVGDTIRLYKRRF